MQITIHITETSTHEQLKAARALIDSLLGEDTWPKEDPNVVRGPDYNTEVYSSEKAADPEPEKPRRKRRTKAEIEADEAAAAGAEETEDASEEKTEAGGDSSLDEAIEVATKLVSDGKVQLVKSALTDAGVKRVSELKEADVPAFLAALAG